MESVFKSFNSSTTSLVAHKPYNYIKQHPTNTTPFASSLAPVPRLPQPPLLPLPAYIHASWPISPTKSRQPPRTKKPRHAAPSPKKAPAGEPPKSTVPVLVAPMNGVVAQVTQERIKKRSMEEQGGGWTGSLYSVSPPPSSVPMPTSLLIEGRKAAACAVQAAGGGGVVDACATDELRRLLRL